MGHIKNFKQLLDEESSTEAWRYVGLVARSQVPTFDKLIARLLRNTNEPEMTCEHDLYIAHFRNGTLLSLNSAPKSEDYIYDDPEDIWTAEEVLDRWETNFGFKQSYKR